MELVACWCTGCVHAHDKKYDDVAPISYYCSEHGYRVPAYHPTVDCKKYKEKNDAQENSSQN